MHVNRLLFPLNFEHTKRSKGLILVLSNVVECAHTSFCEVFFGDFKELAVRLAPT